MGELCSSSPARRGRHRTRSRRRHDRADPRIAGAQGQHRRHRRQALEDGVVDGFCANGMGAELAVRRGVGTVVLDVRRGDGPRACFDYTFPSLAATDEIIERSPDAVAAASVPSWRRRRRSSKTRRSRPVSGASFFRREQAELIAELVVRDAPFYDAAISERTVSVMNAVCARRRHSPRTPLLSRCRGQRVSPPLGLDAVLL